MPTILLPVLPQFAYWRFVWSRVMVLLNFELQIQVTDVFIVFNFMKIFKRWNRLRNKWKQLTCLLNSGFHNRQRKNVSTTKNVDYYKMLHDFQFKILLAKIQLNRDRDVPQIL